jgi:hypothetical protein
MGEPSERATSPEETADNVDATVTTPGDISDGKHTGVNVRLTTGNGLTVLRASAPIAWYAPGGWVKVEFKPGGTT